jgi:hypothetical protein
MMKYSLIFALCLAMLLPACATKPTAVPTAPPTPVPLSTQVIGLVTQAKNIVGIWQVSDSSCAGTLGFLIFRTDGTFTSSCSQDGSHGSSGTYLFDNQSFLIKGFCGPGTGQYAAQIVQGNGQSKSLLFTLIKDDCTASISYLTKQALIWVAALP